MAALLVVAFCIVALFVYMARYSGRIRTEHTRVIAAPWRATYAAIVDLRRWPDWSPWLESAQESSAEYSGASDAAGGTYRWSRQGSDIGRVEHLTIVAPDRIVQRIRLWQPFPMRGVARWQVADCDGKTRVTLSLRGRVAFPMRAFAATVQGSLALDLRYALDRIASLVEGQDAPRYQVGYEGSRDIAALRYAYLERTCALAGLERTRRDALTELREALSSQGVATTGEPIVLYARTDARQRTTTCRFAISIGDAAVQGIAVAVLPAHRAFITRLLGSSEHLEVAWYLAMQQLVATGTAPDLRLMPSEFRRGESAVAPGKGSIELCIPVLAA